MKMIYFLHFMYWYNDLTMTNKILYFVSSRILRREDMWLTIHHSHSHRRLMSVKPSCLFDVDKNQDKDVVGITLSLKWLSTKKSKMTVFLTTELMGAPRTHLIQVSRPLSSTVFYLWVVVIFFFFVFSGTDSNSREGWGTVGPLRPSPSVQGKSRRPLNEKSLLGRVGRQK